MPNTGSEAKMVGFWDNVAIVSPNSVQLWVSFLAYTDRHCWNLQRKNGQRVRLHLHLGSESSGNTKGMTGAMMLHGACLFRELGLVVRQDTWKLVGF